MESQGSISPIACDLTQIPAAVRERLVAELRAVLATVIDVEALTDGYALRFAGPKSPGLLSKLGEIVDYDRLCCPFIGHAIVGEPWGGDVRLQLTGTPEARAYIARELAVALPSGVGERFAALASETR
jgi:hypothetical protein